MFNDGGVLPGGHGRSSVSPQPSASFTITRVCLVPRAGSESFQLGGDYSGRNRNPRAVTASEGVHRPPAGRRWGPAAGGGPVGSFCSTEEGAGHLGRVVEGLHPLRDSEEVAGIAFFASTLRQSQPLNWYINYFSLKRALVL